LTKTYLIDFFSVRTWNTSASSETNLDDDDTLGLERVKSLIQKAMEITSDSNHASQGNADENAE
jgi:hypothetical protein